jgi:ubiquinone/menaquinone biosynthesis C-methylase UbiE
VELDEYRRMAIAEDTHWWYRSTRALLQQLVGPHLPPGGRFLDIGAGTGATGAWLADHGQLVAVDVEPMALTLHRELHPTAEVATCDAGRLPFPDRTFDAAMCVTVLYHASVERPDKVVQEMARVARPGGVVCLCEPGVRRLRRAHDRVTHAARRFARRDLTELLTSAGLTVLRATGAYSFLVPPAVVKALVERGMTSSDLDRNPDGLRGALSGAASVERRLLRRVDLPTGLSVVAIGRR